MNWRRKILILLCSLSIILGYVVADVAGADICCQEPSVKHTSPETPVALVKAQTACAIAVILIPKVASQQRSGPLESSG